MQLVGPVLGPVFGGALSQAFGWRSTFICLAVFCGAVVVPLLAVLVPETHQFKVLRSLQKQQPGVTLKIMEAETILNAKPVLQGPWVAVGYLLESGILPYALVTMMIFGILIASLTEWPAQMSTAPYSMNEAIMGISYLANGLGGLFSSPVGGKVSDFTAARHPGILEARLLGNTAIAAFIMPVGCLLYGWSLQEKTHLVAPLVGHFLIGAASAGWMPGFYGYVSSVKQANAGAASAAGQFVMFVTAGSLVLVSVSAVHKMGIGPYFTLLAGLQFLLAAVAACCIWKQFRLQNRQRQHEAAGPKPARNLHTS
jgi:MFS family permease